MEFKEIIDKAKKVREKYHELEIKKYGQAWTGAEIAEGFVGDVGDLMKLVLAKKGVREITDVDKKLAHELSDCLWSILVLADKYGIDIEKEFVSNMDELEKRVEGEL